MLKTGNTDISAVKLGTTDVSAIYVGAAKIWPAGLLELSASSLSFSAAGQTQTLGISVEDGKTWSISGTPAGWSLSASSGTGSATVTVTAPNNTTASAKTGTLVVASEDLTASCALSQAAGAKVYGAWQNVSLTIDTTSFAASGGTSAMRVNVKRTWTWNGVAGSGGEETATASLASPSTSDSIASVSGNTLTVSSLGTTFKAATTITVSAQTEHDTTRVSATVTQAANYVTSINSLKTRTLTYSQIGAGGGTSDCQWDSYSGTALNTLWSCTFASGATGTATDADAVGNFRQIGVGYSWTGPSGTITSLNGTTGAITATSRGTTVGNAITVTVNAIQIVVFDNPSSVGGSTTPELHQPVTGTCTQAANAVTNTTQSGGTYTYGNVSAGTITNATIPASGGSATATAGNGSQSWNRTEIIATDTYTSGSTAQRTIQGATSGTNTVAPSRTSLSGSAGSKGTVQSGQTTVQSATVTWSANGMSASGTMYVYQGANYPTVTGTTCDLTTLVTNYKWTSGAVSSSRQENSYTCGYRVTLGVGISIMQSGVMVSPVINTMRAYSCWGNTVQYQGTSYVDFPNPSFGENAATLTLNQSETSNHSSITYVLYQCNITYTDSGGTGALPNYVWSNAVTYSGSLAIYTAANAPSAMLTVSAATRSTTSLQEDAENLLAQAESAGIELTDEIKAELTAIADGKE